MCRAISASVVAGVGAHPPGHPQPHQCVLGVHHHRRRLPVGEDRLDAGDRAVEDVPLLVVRPEADLDRLPEVDHPAVEVRRSAARWRRRRPRTGAPAGCAGPPCPPRPPGGRSPGPGPAPGRLSTLNTGRPARSQRVSHRNPRRGAPGQPFGAATGFAASLRPRCPRRTASAVGGRAALAVPGGQRLRCASRQREPSSPASSPVVPYRDPRRSAVTEPLPTR